MDLHFCHCVFGQSWSLGQNLRDRDLEQKLEMRLILKRSETETRPLKPNVCNIFDTKFWTFGELPNTLQYRFLGISLLY